MSATLIVGKFALSFIPNVEVVTLFIVLYSYVFGFESVFSTLVFCLVDTIIYPPSLDVVISYFIYFNLLAVIVATISSLNVKNQLVFIVVGTAMTAIFGVITSFFTSLIMSVNFAPVYLAGLYFYGIHVVSNAVILTFGFKPLSNVLLKIKTRQ